VYRRSIEYVAASYATANGLSGANRHIRDPWLCAAQSIALNIAEGSGKQNLKDQNRYFQIAGGSAGECAAVYDMLLVFAAVDEESTRQRKSQLRRIVSLLTRLIQRTERETEAGFEYKYEYRDGEYE
jgi:four helix bundle protein